ncbi:MAG TPA: SdrD B-like domain-containing protein [Pseudonocardiaceae bacterium]|nr:SdrD B-like domain-containing protein [Pseudonocardiaceae bacterium]
MLRSRARLAGALVVLGTATGALVTPAAAAGAATPGYGCVVDTPSAGAPAAYQPLKLCASFDRLAYRSTDVVKLTISVTNLGSATAPGVSLPYPVQSGFEAITDASPASSLFSYSPQPAGLDLPAGATVTAEIDGYAAGPASGSVSYTGKLAQGGGMQATYGSPLTISVPVTAVTGGGYSGRVFIDTQAKGLAGAQVTLEGPWDGINGGDALDETVTTDAKGGFAFSNLPGGDYSVGVIGPTGWVVVPPGNGLVHIDGSSQTGVQLPATRPLSDTLQAAISFDQPSYRIGTAANLTINLTNTGTTAIDGIQAFCDPGSSPTGVQLRGQGAAWATLDGTGVNLAAGQRTTLHLSEIVPAGPAGPLVAECVFGPNVHQNLNGYPDAEADATATAPSGRTIGFGVRFVDDDPIGGVATTSVTLADVTSGDPIASGAAAGYPTEDNVAQLAAVPDGTYALNIGKGWTLAPGQSATLNTAAIGSGQTVDVHVVPTTPQPAPPTPPTT